MQPKYLSFAQTVNAIAKVGPKRTILVEGENGIGKTALLGALRQLPQFANHIIPDPIDCTQLSDGSVWMPYINAELGTSCEFPNERFGVNARNQKGVAGSRPSLIALDEVLKAPQYIKNVLAPIIYERRVGNFHLVEGSVVVCFTNLALEGLGDQLQAHLRNRIIRIKMRKPTADEWLKWAADAGIADSVRAFVNNYPAVMHSFVDYDEGGAFYKAGVKPAERLRDNPYIFNPWMQQDNYASPRSLHAASDIIKENAELDDDTLDALLCGALGTPAAQQLSAFVRFERDIPDYARVVKDPLGTPLCESPTAQIVQVMQFQSRTRTRDDAEAVVKYVQRMSPTMQTMFANTINNGSTVALFCTIRAFSEILAENKQYL
jgi:hypothetical protein